NITQSTNDKKTTCSFDNKHIHCDCENNCQIINQLTKCLTQNIQTNQDHISSSKSKSYKKDSFSDSDISIQSDIYEKSNKSKTSEKYEKMSKSNNSTDSNDNSYLTRSKINEKSDKIIKSN